MKQVLELIAARTTAFRQLPLYTFMADRSVPPEMRLPYGPHVAYFILSFADLCKLVLREEPASDQLQTHINRHAEEERDHWEWYLQDLATLGLDQEMRFSEALRVLWGNETEKARLLTYRLVHLSMGANSLQKLVLILCMEATAGVGMESTTRVANEVSDLIGTPLVFYGSHHKNAEDAHTLLADDMMQSIENMLLDPQVRQSLLPIVNEVFDAFTDFVNEIAEYLSAQAATACSA